MQRVERRIWFTPNGPGLAAICRYSKHELVEEIREGIVDEPDLVTRDHVSG